MNPGANGEECVVWIGPGRRLGDLAPLLAAVPALRGRCASGMIGDLCGSGPSSGVVLIDADALRAEDILDLQRFMARSNGSRLMLIGDDAGRRGVRGLLRSERVHWMSWPLDIEDMYAIAAWPGEKRFSAPLGDVTREEWSSSSTHAGTRSQESRATSTSSSEAVEPRLDPNRRSRSPVQNALTTDIVEIERVLGAADFRPEHRASTPTPVSELDLDLPEERVPVDEDDLPEMPDDALRHSVLVREGGERAAFHAPPPEASSGSFRSQVADLADIAQRIELSLQGLREEHDGAAGGSGAPAALESVAREVARLVQFTRTLGYLVSPPGPGSQVFDLTEMLEVFLTEIRSGGPDAPRCLLRSNGALNVRSDRQLLSQAFDALFFMARSAAGRGEIVRVQARRDEEGSPQRAQISIDFPGGKLLEATPAAILEPYGLRRILPDLGPNALSAAVRIIEGQGGHCRLEPQSRGRLEWSVSLPLASVDGTVNPRLSGKDSESELATGMRADDPFA